LPVLDETVTLLVRSFSERREIMVRKLETGDYLLERDPEAASPNRIRKNVDAESEARAEANKKALFKKLK
jgi:hypothetical protein